MRGSGQARSLLRLNRVTGLVLGVAVLAAAGQGAVLPASGAARPAGGPHAQRPFSRSNVGAAHSPELLRQLAGGRRGRTAFRQAAATGSLQGLDVASYQHPKGAAINWQSVAAGGVQFAAVKGTEGTYYRNPYALTDLAGARAAGLSVMAYAFAIPNGNGGSKSATAQADFLLNYLASGIAPMPTVVLDIEYNPYGGECYGLSATAMVAWITTFSATVQAWTGQEPVIYTPPQWWQRCTGGSTAFGQFPLWAPGGTTGPSPALPAGWTGWAFWQYTSSGTVKGVDDPGRTDLDELNPAVIPLLDPGERRGVAGGPVDLRTKTADPVAGRKLSYSASGLPPGVGMGSTGQITGRPRATGLYSTSVTASSTSGVSGTVSFEWRVHAVRRPRSAGRRWHSPLRLSAE